MLLARECAIHSPSATRACASASSIVSPMAAQPGASIHSGRDYNPAIGSWLQNALAQQAIQPFHAIIARTNPTSNEGVVVVSEVDEANALIAVPTSAAIDRDASSLAAAMKLLLRSAKTVFLVDAYYDPFNSKYQDTLRACLHFVHEGNPSATFEIHHLDHGRCPPTEAIERGQAKVCRRDSRGNGCLYFSMEGKAGRRGFSRPLFVDG